MRSAIEAVPVARPQLAAAALLEPLDRVRELLDALLLRARAVLDLADGREQLLAAGGLRFVARVELAHHVRDVLDGARDLTASTRLLLRASLDVLRDDPHLLGALHDELRPARLFRCRCGDLLHRLGDAPDRVGDLLAALRLFDRRARDRAHHVRALLRALEDLLERALGLVGHLDAAVDVVGATLDRRDGVLAFRLHRLDEVRDLARARAGALGQIGLDLVGHDGEALALLAGLRGDDRGVEREQAFVLLDCRRR